MFVDNIAAPLVIIGSTEVAEILDDEEAKKLLAGGVATLNKPEEPATEKDIN